MTTDEPTASVSPASRGIVRRLAPVLVAYCGAAGGLIQVADIVVNRYVLSPFLVHLCIVLPILMLPTVLLLAYFRGIPGPNPWTQAEKIGIPVNVLAAGIILFVSFHGTELGAATEVVTAKDPAGSEIRREIAKPAFRKRVALFFFDNPSGDPELNWIQQAITVLLAIDLSQDSFVVSFIPYNFVARLKKSGLNQDSNVPLGLKQELARSSNLDHILAGSFTRSGGEYSVRAELYNTQRGTRETERTFRDRDLFQLVDEMSIQLKRDLDIPKRHIETVTDLPVKEVTTASVDALREFVIANNILAFKNDYPEAARRLEAAVDKDATFAFAHLVLASVHLSLGDMSKARSSAGAVRQNEYRLTERTRFSFRQFDYFLNKEPERRLSVINQWIALYPEDVEAHKVLAAIYEARNQYEKSVEIRKKILEIDPANFDELSSLGNAYRTLGNYEKSLEYYRQYIDQLPAVPAGYIRLGLAYELLARYQDARNSYQEGLSRDPDNVDAVLGLAGVQLRLGEFTQALGKYESALQRAKLPTEKYKIYAAKRDYHRFRHEWRKALESAELGIAQLKTIAPTLVLVHAEIDNIDIYVNTNRKHHVIELMREQEAKAGPENFLLSLYVRLGYLSLYSATGEGAKALPLIDEIEQLVRQSGVEAARRDYVYLEGRGYESSGNCARAAETYQQYLKNTPAHYESMIHLGRCQRMIGDLGKAETALQQALKLFPAYPEAHYEMALALAKRGEVAKSREHLRVALNGWSEADPEDPLVAEARSLESKLALH